MSGDAIPGLSANIFLSPNSRVPYKHERAECREERLFREWRFSRKLANANLFNLAGSSSAYFPNADIKFVYVKSSRNCANDSGINPG